jgi:signal transduction histidine kinase
LVHGQRLRAAVRWASTMIDAFRRLTLTRQFLDASFPILLAGMLAVGLFVEREIEQGVVKRIGEVQSLYVDSLVAPHLETLLENERLDDARRAELDALFAGTPLGKKIVAFVLWRPDGRVMYSNQPDLIGRSFPVEADLTTALRGEVFTHILDRRVQPHGFALENWPDRLVETYAPVHAEALGKVLGAAEFYQTTDELDEAMRSARWRTWGVVVATALAMYVLLFGLVRRASRTIVDQRQALRERVAELSGLLETNERLDATVRRAAARTTSLNERFLRRIAADLHDGPAQDLGFAQMRLVSMAESAAPSGGAGVTVAASDLAAVRTAVDTAMADLRSISAGMQLPEIEQLSPADVAARAVRDYERKTGAPVAWSAAGDAPDAALPVKITIYRVLQELLANGFRHAGAANQHVSVVQSRDDVTLEVGDRGPGFDVASEVARGRGGLAGLRERVHVLGGTFDVESTHGEGTVARVRLPLSLSGASDG